MPNNVVAVVLAAGQSARAGETNKLLFHHRGQPLVLHVIDSLQASTIERIVVVTGHQREQIETLMKPTNIRCVYNPDYDSGMASSVKLGTASASDADAVLVCLADMPHITAQIIDSIVACAEQYPDKAAIVPTWQGKQGNPVLIKQPLFVELQAISGDRGAKGLLAEHAQQVQEIAIDSSAVLQDYDTQDALAKLDAQS